MKIKSQPAKGLFLLEKETYSDERGLFQRTFCIEDMKDVWGDRQVVQSNRSITKKVGAFRGLHYQTSPYAEMKFVHCMHGRVLDIAVDIRKNSETFLKNFCFELSGQNNLCLLIPEGFAHGFQVLEENSEMIYFHSAPYAKEYEKGLNYQDPKLILKLPLKVSEITGKDSSYAFLDAGYKGLEL